MTYAIQFDTRVLTDDWPKLPKTMQVRIRQAITERLTIAPDQLGKPLRHNFAGCYRLRVGDYRIVYFMKADLREVVILTIKHRKDVYDD